MHTVEHPEHSHPAWCDRSHSPGASHNAKVAVEPLETSSVRVGLFQWTRAVVTVDLVHTPVDDTFTVIPGPVDVESLLALSPDAARRLAAALTLAAEKLDWAVVKRV